MSGGDGTPGCECDGSPLGFLEAAATTALGTVTPDCPSAVRAFLACPVSRFVEPLASVTLRVEVRTQVLSGSSCGVKRKMSLPFFATLVAAALTPRHSGAIAQRQLGWLHVRGLFHHRLRDVLVS